MKMHVPLLVVLSGFVPIGIAVAEYADAPRAAAPADDHAQQLTMLGQKMAESVSKARAQLAAAVEHARANDDALLAACLESKHEELLRLEGQATAQLASLRGAEDAGAAQIPYVVITVIGQKATLVVEEAALCVGADQDGPGVQIDDIAPPTDPNAELPAGPFDVVQPGAPSIPVVLPPPPAPVVTTGDPSTDLPMDMPPVPPEASPVR